MPYGNYMMYMYMYYIYHCQSPLKWKPKCSPAVSLEDLLSSGSISPIVDYNGRVRKTG